MPLRPSPWQSAKARTGTEAPETMGSGTAEKRKPDSGSAPRLQRCSTIRISLRAYRKIGVSTRAAAALFAMQHGLVASGELPIVRHASHW